eukprot:3602561-Amphidinium_carterae.1
MVPARFFAFWFPMGGFWSAGTLHSLRRATHNLVLPTYKLSKQLFGGIFGDSGVDTAVGRQRVSDVLWKIGCLRQNTTLTSATDPPQRIKSHYNVEAQAL